MKEMIKAQSKKIKEKLLSILEGSQSFLNILKCRNEHFYCNVVAHLAIQSNLRQALKLKTIKISL